MDKKDIPQIDWKQTDALISLALSEDLDTVGDATTNSVIPENLQAKAVFLTKEDCVCAGLPVAERLFKTIDPELEWKTLVREGEFCPRGTIMAEVRGNARALLTANAPRSTSCKGSAAWRLRQNVIRMLRMPPGEMPDSRHPQDQLRAGGILRSMPLQPEVPSTTASGFSTEL